MIYFSGFISRLWEKSFFSSSSSVSWRVVGWLCPSCSGLLPLFAFPSRLVTNSRLTRQTDVIKSRTIFGECNQQKKKKQTKNRWSKIETKSSGEVEEEVVEQQQQRQQQQWRGDAKSLCWIFCLVRKCGDSAVGEMLMHDVSGSLLQPYVRKM